ncbi:MAG: hypothetical protein P8J64_04475 [Dehalococcoidia bacterium]|nr:hypothetical protein [Dehalococcoidia bacterium]
MAAAAPFGVVVRARTRDLLNKYRKNTANDLPETPVTRWAPVSVSPDDETGTAP